MLKKMVFLITCCSILVGFCSRVYAELPDFTKLAENSGKAVVNVSTSQKPKKPKQQRTPLPEGTPFDDFFKHYFEEPGGQYVPKETNSLGSGFIISKDGYILTNHHVVKDADEIIVKLSDRRELDAELIGSDPRSDIAVLKVKNGNSDLPVVKLGSSQNLKVGEWVLAIGSPFGFDRSVTAGIVSAKGRNLPGDNYVPFIQTDVAINPGNSGGPLFNMKGEVVGINSQIYSRTGGFMGLSFSIPMEVVMSVVDQIKDKGKVSRGWLGVQIQDVTRELAESFGMDRPHGALVSKVLPNSPAKSAGVVIGDIIVGFNGKTIETSSELPPMVGIAPVNKKGKLTVIRQGVRKTFNVTVGLLPDQGETELGYNQSEQSGFKSIERMGIEISDLTTEQREQFQLAQNGVLVQQVKQGPAANAGIQRGDIVLRIQNNVIRNVANFDKIVAKLIPGKSVAILIQRRGSPVFLAIKIDK